MNEREINENYLQLMDAVDVIILETQSRVLSNTPDVFFESNVNFFVKAYLITICTYLESFLKDIAHMRVELISEKVKQTKLPQNLIRWSLADLRELKDAQAKFEDLSINIKKKDLGEHVSGQPHRTLDLFKYIGLDLTECQGFVTGRDEVKNIVLKRNSIIHHNDDAPRCQASCRLS
jgi:hypothetical protein